MCGASLTLGSIPGVPAAPEMAELPHRSQIARPCHGLAIRTPVSQALIAAARSIARSPLEVARSESLKTAQRCLTTPVRITQGVLEHQELLDILPQRAGR